MAFEAAALRMRRLCSRWCWSASLSLCVTVCPPLWWEKRGPHHPPVWVVERRRAREIPERNGQGTRLGP